MRYTTAISLLLLFGCIDRIPFDAGVQEDFLVIYGQFSAYDKDHEVTIRRTKEFGTAEEPVQDATVKVFDEDGNFGEFIHTEPGTYMLSRDDLFRGKVGDSYHIEITFESGKVYRSEPQELLEAMPLKEVNFELFYREEVTTANSLISKPYLKVLISTDTQKPNGEGAYIRWWVREEYAFTDLQCHPLDKRVTCYFKLPPNVTSFPTFESVSTKQKAVTNLQVFERDLSPDWQFNERHMFSVHQYIMSEEAYDYWQRVAVASDQTGSVFDKQPAAVPGNIFVDGNTVEVVLGYFEVVGESVNRVYTLKDSLLPLQVIPACIDFINNYRSQHNFCCFCWLIDSERIPRPDYWGDE